MKKTDKNIIIFIILGILAVLIWTSTQYSKTKKDTKEQDEITQQTRKNEKEDEQEREKPREEAAQIIPTISGSELNRKINSDDITIIDARSRTLYDGGHIRGSILLEDVDPTQIKRTVVLVTSNGAEDLVLNYYRDLSSTKTVYNLAGGISNWSKEGHALLSIINTPSFETSSKVQFVEPRELDVVMKDPAQKDTITIIDTRRNGNFTKEHIPGAINIPLTEVESRFKELPRTKKIYIYGADEDASFQAGVLLHDLRFISTKTIKGGFAAWKEYGYPVTE